MKHPVNVAHVERDRLVLEHETEQTEQHTAMLSELREFLVQQAYEIKMLKTMGVP